MEQKKKLIIGGVVAVALVGLLYLSLRSKPNILSVEEPKFDIKDLKNLTSGKDDQVMVAFQGYAKYLSPDYGKQVYLALAPVSQVQVTDTVKAAPETSVCFKSAAGSMSMSFIKIKDQFNITSISVQTADGDENKSCKVDDAAIHYSENEHYECESPKTLSCVRTHKDKDGKAVEIKVAELIIGAIRAETNGKAADHKAGRFTHPARLCGSAKQSVEQNEEILSQVGSEPFDERMLA